MQDKDYQSDDETTGGKVEGIFPIKEGYLLKKGQSWGSWKKRYFILKPDFMLYFESEEDLFHPLGMIYLAGATLEHDYFEKERSYTFAIIGGSNGVKDRVNVLQATGDKERNQWTDAIEKAITSVEEKKREKEISYLTKSIQLERDKLSDLETSVTNLVKPTRFISDVLKKFEKKIQSYDETSKLQLQNLQSFSLSRRYLLSPSSLIPDDFDDEEELVEANSYSNDPSVKLEYISKRIQLDQTLSKKLITMLNRQEKFQEEKRHQILQSLKEINDKIPKLKEERKEIFENVKAINQEINDQIGIIDIEMRERFAILNQQRLVTANDDPEVAKTLQAQQDLNLLKKELEDLLNEEALQTEQINTLTQEKRQLVKQIKALK